MIYDTPSVMFLLSSLPYALPDKCHIAESEDVTPPCKSSSSAWKNCGHKSHLDYLLHSCIDICFLMLLSFCQKCSFTLWFHCNWLLIIRQYKLIAGFCYAVIFISSCINHQDRNFAAAYRRAVYIVMTITI